MKVSWVRHYWRLQLLYNRSKTLLYRRGSSDVIKKALEGAKEARAELIKSENKISDQSIVAAVLQMYYKEIDKSTTSYWFLRWRKIKLWRSER